MVIKIRNNELKNKEWRSYLKHSFLFIKDVTMKASTYFILLVFFVIAILFGQDQKPQVNDPCANPQTTIEMRECASKRFNEADTELNRVFAKLLSGLSDDNEHKAKLRLSQDTWLKYRDANSDFEAYFYNGGTVQQQIRLNCLTRMTQNRTKELQTILNKEFNK